MTPSGKFPLSSVTSQVADPIPNQATTLEPAGLAHQASIFPTCKAPTLVDNNLSALYLKVQVHSGMDMHIHPALGPLDTRCQTTAAKADTSTDASIFPLTITSHRLQRGN